MRKPIEKKPCADCDGKGYEWVLCAGSYEKLFDCHTCNGFGQVPHDSDDPYDVPYGMKPGSLGEEQ